MGERVKLETVLMTYIETKREYLCIARHQKDKDHGTSLDMNRNKMRETYSYSSIGDHSIATEFQPQLPK